MVGCLQAGLKGVGERKLPVTIAAVANRKDDAHGRGLGVPRKSAKPIKRGLGCGWWSVIWVIAKV